MTPRRVYGISQSDNLLQVTNQAQAWADFDAANEARIQQWNKLGGIYNPTGDDGNAR